MCQTRRDVWDSTGWVLGARESRPRSQHPSLPPMSTDLSLGRSSARERSDGGEDERNPVAFQALIPVRCRAMPPADDPTDHTAMLRVPEATGDAVVSLA